MQFIDRARISVKAGDGGDGKSSFRREKYIPKGGPNGGDGGRGGDIVFEVDRDENTLLKFRFKKTFKGERGGHGDVKNQVGRSAEPCVIKVPAGTLIKDATTDRVLADLVSEGQREVIARGGRGGRGNARFKSSSRRAPTFAEYGEPGESKDLLLELKLLADVGLVGYPSVGKSSLIAAVSDARPEIAEYHFTTLTPVLGVVRTGYESSYVIADIPGLIDGAADGVGLGHDFLRHVERTRLLLHIVDASGFEGRDPTDDYRKIRAELEKYSSQLEERPEIIVGNKIDLSREHVERLEALAESEGKKFFAISVATREGMNELMQYVGRWIEEHPVERVQQSLEHVIDLDERDDDPIEIRRNERGEYEVSNRNIEKIASMTNFDNSEGLRRFQYILRMKGVDEELRRRGIAEGALVRIGAFEFEWRD